MGGRWSSTLGRCLAGIRAGVLARWVTPELADEVAAESRAVLKELASGLAGPLRAARWQVPAARTSRRPAGRPARSRAFRDRVYSATISPESAEIMARLGTGVLIIPQKPWAQVKKDCDTFRAIFTEAIGTNPPPPVIAGWTYVDSNADRAEEQARKWIGGYEKVTAIAKLTGGDSFIPVFRYAGMPKDQAEANMRLFAAEVMPELKKYTAVPAPVA